MSGGEQEKGRPMAQKVTFEDAMKRLEEIVRRLEEEKVPLEESIRLYEEGMKIGKRCWTHSSTWREKRPNPGYLPASYSRLSIRWDTSNT